MRRERDHYRVSHAAQAKIFCNTFQDCKLSSLCTACTLWKPFSGHWIVLRKRPYVETWATPLILHSLTEYTECQAFCPVVQIAHPPAKEEIPARGKGERGSNSDERTDTLVLHVYYNSPTHSFIPRFLFIWPNDGRGGRCEAESYDRKPGPLLIVQYSLHCSLHPLPAVIVGRKHYLFTTTLRRGGSGAKYVHSKKAWSGERN
jgi:hypothetical protein